MNMKKWKIIALVFMGLFLASLILIGLLLTTGDTISKRDIKIAAKVIGLQFSADERKLMLEGVQRNLDRYQEMRKYPLDNMIPPALTFLPLNPGALQEEEPAESTIQLPESSDLEAPENLEDLAFASVSTLARLIKSRKITSMQLTKMYLERLKKYGPLLECVVTLTEDLAWRQARRADEEMAVGQYRGPLHGIPWGAKDILAVKGYKTTWGAMPYRHQVIDLDATVVKKLEEAGAVLVAKLTTGALAMGDVWFGGTTRNPWDVKQGSSGSSAGPASATAAGLVAFALGSETRGSIISPSTRCGVTGLRPSFGRVSRFGAMALSWSMDKVGPICRSADDCALVFAAIHGSDGRDRTVLDLPFHWPPTSDIKSLRIGYLKQAFEREYRSKKNQENDQAAMQVLRDMGVELIPLELPDVPVDALSFILTAEAAAAFDELTRGDRDDLLVRQTQFAWPNIFRVARLIPAVEYIQANRMRTILIQEMNKKIAGIDVYLAPSFDSDNLALTNLTGHPAVVAANGFDEEGHPTSITFTGSLYQEEELLAAAKAFQEATTHHLKRPQFIK